ncbi:hypothetical protein [Frankia sp. Cr2]|uniref:hypothetical protein n=1 Tax=Frankia sp. Cr2 TaxID=3073932 RepID=UPI002AD5838B|nr:hypothetical protein [Frankia sp. Cr2]
MTPPYHALAAGVGDGTSVDDVGTTCGVGTGGVGTGEMEWPGNGSTVVTGSGGDGPVVTTAVIPAVGVTPVGPTVPGGIPPGSGTRDFDPVGPDRISGVGPPSPPAGVAARRFVAPVGAAAGTPDAVSGAPSVGVGVTRGTGSSREFRAAP